MNRFYVAKSNISAPFIKITDKDDVRHLVKALRMTQGEQIFISDGEGGSYMTEVSQISSKSVTLHIKKSLRQQHREDKKVNLTLACAVPANTRFEDVVDKMTQLGVDEIIPLWTDRTQAQRDAFDRKKERFRKIMIAAAKQSGALFLPQLKEMAVLDDIIKTVGRYDLSLLPNLSCQALCLRDAVSGFSKGRILILIGPEGDFTPREIGLALQAGCVGISLGTSVLRVDTAAISVVSFLRLYFDL